MSYLMKARKSACCCLDGLAKVMWIASNSTFLGVGNSVILPAWVLNHIHLAHLGARSDDLHSPCCCEIRTAELYSVVCAVNKRWDDQVVRVFVGPSKNERESEDNPDID